MTLIGEDFQFEYCSVSQFGWIHQYSFGDLSPLVGLLRFHVSTKAYASFIWWHRKKPSKYIQTHPRKNQRTICHNPCPTWYVQAWYGYIYIYIHIYIYKYMFYIICRLIDTVFKYVAYIHSVRPVGLEPPRNKPMRPLVAAAKGSKRPPGTHEGSSHTSWGIRGVFCWKDPNMFSEGGISRVCWCPLTLSHRRKWWKIYLCLTGNYY